MARTKQPRIKVSDQRAMGLEPEFSGEMHRDEILRALNWYNYYHDIKTSRKWILEYMKKMGYSTAQIGLYRDAKDSSITQTQASIARMLMRGAVFENSLQEHIDGVLARSQAVQTATETAKQVVHMNTDNVLIADLDDILDTFYRSNYKLEITDSDLKIGMYSPQNIRGALVHMKELQDELKSLDEDVAEAYGRLTKRQSNKYIKLVDMIVESLENALVKKKRAKVVRKPRRKKEKTVEQQLKSFKYAQASKEVDIVSIDPTKIIGASVLWVYNTKYRRLTMFVAADGGFAVKGTTLQNVDLTKSLSKKLRKPEEILPKILKEGKAKIAKEFKELRTKGSEPKPRINEQTLLLRVFK